MISRRIKNNNLKDRPDRFCRHVEEIVDVYTGRSFCTFCGELLETARNLYERSQEANRILGYIQEVKQLKSISQRKAEMREQNRKDKEFEEYIALSKKIKKRKSKYIHNNKFLIIHSNVYNQQQPFNGKFSSSNGAKRSES